MLPFPSQASGSEALLYANNRELHVHMPVDQSSWCAGPDPGMFGRSLILPS